MSRLMGCKSILSRKCPILILAVLASLLALTNFVPGWLPRAFRAHFYGRGMLSNSTKILKLANDENEDLDTSLQHMRKIADSMEIFKDKKLATASALTNISRVAKQVEGSAKQIVSAIAEFDVSRSSESSESFLEVSTHSNEIIQLDQLRYYKDGMSNRWAATSKKMTDINWSVDTQFPCFEKMSLETSMTYIIDPSACEKSTKAIVITNSAVANFDKRQFVRENFPTPPSWRRLFLVGKPVLNADVDTRCDQELCEVDKELLAKIIEEDSIYHDLLVPETLDVYQNITFKVLAMLDWTTTRCTNAKSLWKIDDDCWPNFSVLDKALAKFEEEHHTSAYWVGIPFGGHPWRTGTKNAIQKSDYPAEEFPIYASGNAHWMSMETAHVFNEVIRKLPWFKVEDVLLGVVARLSGIQLEQFPFANDSDNAQNCERGFLFDYTPEREKWANEWKSCNYYSTVQPTIETTTTVTSPTTSDDQSSIKSSGPIEQNKLN